MTKLLDEAVAAAALIRSSAEEEASFDESFAEAERGEFATEEQIRAIWSKHGREIIVHGVRHGARDPRSMPK